MSTRAKIAKQLMKTAFPKRKEIKPQIIQAAQKTKWNILRGDIVQVIDKKHPENGKQGVVSLVDRKRDRVIVTGVNLAPKHIKPNVDQGRLGKTVMKERSIHYSNVNLVDPVTGLPTRVSRKLLEDGTKVRIAKRSGAIIPRPEILTQRKRPQSTTVTDSCTRDGDDVWEVTYIQSWNVYWLYYIMKRRWSNSDNRMVLNLINVWVVTGYSIILYNTQHKQYKLVYVQCNITSYIISYKIITSKIID